MYVHVTVSVRIRLLYIQKHGPRWHSNVDLLIKKIHGCEVSDTEASNFNRYYM